MKTISKKLKALTLTLSLGSTLMIPALAKNSQAETSIRIASPISSKLPRVVHLGDQDLSSPKKPGSDKGPKVDQEPIGGVPTRDGKTVGNSNLPEGLALSLDPSARPDLANFKRKQQGDDFFGTDDRLNRGQNGLARLRDIFTSLLQLGGSANAPEGDVQPGDTRYGNEESMVGGGVIDDTKKGAKSYADTVTNSDEDNSPGGIAKRQAKEEEEFLSATTKTSSDGTVTKDTLPNGTVRVRDENNGTTTTLYPDGSTRTVDNETGKVIDSTKPSTSMPDPDHEGAPLPADIQKQLDDDMAKLRAAGPQHIQGNIDFGDEGADAGMPVGKADKSAPVPDKKKGLINPGTPEATTPAHPSLDQDEVPFGPDQNVIHVE